MRIIVGGVSVAELLARSSGRWVVYLGAPVNPFDEGEFPKFANHVDSAVPFLAGDVSGKPGSYRESFYDFCLGDPAFCVFESELEARVAYESVVGDEGPTKTNDYNGPVSVYAALVSPTEGCVTENT